jgi:alpha-mannosidase
MPGELWPATLTNDGVKFKLGPVGAANAVLCQGQEVPLPVGYKRVYILAAADGDLDATFKAGGASTTFHVQDWSAFVGQWDDRVMNEDTMIGLHPAFIKRAPIAWLGTHRHDKDGQNEPYVYCYAFQYGIDVPKGATTLTLPGNPKVRVFAVSVANDPNAETVPAQPLYDVLDRTGFPWKQ